MNDVIDLVAGAAVGTAVWGALSRVNYIGGRLTAIPLVWAAARWSPGARPSPQAAPESAPRQGSGLARLCCVGRWRAK